MSDTEIIVRGKYSNDNPEIVVHRMEIPNWPATIALTLIERWGMVSARDDGEDTAHRAKLALLSPHETVERACVIAELAVTAFRERGWTVKLPSLDEAKEQLTGQKPAKKWHGLK